MASVSIVEPKQSAMPLPARRRFFSDGGGVLPIGSDDGRSMEPVAALAARWSGAEGERCKTRSLLSLFMFWSQPMPT